MKVLATMSRWFYEERNERVRRRFPSVSAIARLLVEHFGASRLDGDESDVDAAWNES